jgi:hypothetical protein
VVGLDLQHRLVDALAIGRQPLVLGPLRDLVERVGVLLGRRLLGLQLLFQLCGRLSIGTNGEEEYGNESG